MASNISSPAALAGSQTYAHAMVHSPVLLIVVAAPPDSPLVAPAGCAVGPIGGSRRHWRSPRFWKRPEAHGHQERAKTHAPCADIEPCVAGEGVEDQAARDRSGGHAETAGHRGAADHRAHHLQRE